MAICTWCVSTDMMQAPADKHGFYIEVPSYSVSISGKIKSRGKREIPRHCCFLPLANNLQRLVPSRDQSHCLGCFDINCDGTCYAR